MDYDNFETSIVGWSSQKVIRLIIRTSTFNDIGWDHNIQSTECPKIFIANLYCICWSLPQIFFFRRCSTDFSKCLRSNVVSHYRKWVTTSWTYNTYINKTYLIAPQSLAANIFNLLACDLKVLNWSYNYRFSVSFVWKWCNSFLKLLQLQKSAERCVLKVLSE